MIRVVLVRDSSGAFVSCEAEGHAGYDAAGHDIVCSAVTILLRTAVQVLSGTPGVELTAAAPERGNMKFSVQVKQGGLETAARLVCTGDFIEKGLASLSGEYPDNVELRKQTV